MTAWQVPRFEAAYPVAMLAAIATFAVVRAAQPTVAAVAQLSKLDRLRLLGAAFIGGTFGSKLPFVLANGQLLSWEGWLIDGKTVLSGIVGAYLAVELMKWARGIRVGTGDHFALPFAASMAVGRWGCLFNGCCYGTPTSLPWALQFESLPGSRHPTQIYESLFHAVMALMIGVWIAKNQWPQRRLQIYLIAYCLFRFLTEFVRPEPVIAWGLTAYQWTAAGFAAALLIQSYFRRPSLSES